MSDNRKTTPNLPTAAEFCKNLDTVTEQSRALTGIKSQTVRIPPAIRTQMRGLARLSEWWAKNRAAYTGLVEASQQTGGAKSQRAGA